VEVWVFADGFRGAGDSSHNLVGPFMQGVADLFTRLRDGRRVVEALRSWRVQWCRLRVMDCSRRLMPADDEWIEGGEMDAQKAA